jgi:hypothetical protein
MSSLRRRHDRISSSIASLKQELLVARRDSVHGIVHREVHHREGTLAFKRAKAVARKRDLICLLAPRDDDGAVHDYARVVAGLRASATECK